MAKIKIGNWLKNNWVTFILMGFLALIIFVPSTKAWILEKVISTGIFNAKIKKEDLKNNPQSIPPFSYTSLTGEISSTEDLKGKIIFINFWASWCPPCRAEMPSLTYLYEQLKDDERFVFLFITEDEDVSKATDYLNKNNYNIPVFKLSGNISPGLYRGTLPTTIVLNKQGRMVYKHEGIAGYNSPAFLQQLKALL